jgi:hypothetical protein
VSDCDYCFTFVLSSSPGGLNVDMLLHWSLHYYPALRLFTNFSLSKYNTYTCSTNSRVMHLTQVRTKQCNTTSPLLTPPAQALYPIILQNMSPRAGTRLRFHRWAQRIAKLPILGLRNNEPGCFGDTSVFPITSKDLV